MDQASHQRKINTLKNGYFIILFYVIKDLEKK
jgi:hypothetical protein